MQFKQKLVYIALGGVLVIIGQILPNIVVSKATTQGKVVQGKTKSAEFDSVTCRNLKIVDSSGRVRAKLEFVKNKFGTPTNSVIQVFNSNGIPVYSAGSSAEHGAVSIYGEDGKPRAMISASTLLDGGTMAVFGKDSLIPRAVMGPGSIGLFGNNTPIGVGLEVLPSGGSITVQDNNGRTCAQMRVNEYGVGMVGVYSKEGDMPRAAMSVIPRSGHGVVTTLNSSGSISGMLGMRF